jgi:hypothetical protein
MIDLDALERTAREAPETIQGATSHGAIFIDDACEAFYATARAALPALIARVRALEAERDQLRAAIAGYKAATERCDGIIDAERAMFRALGDPTFICPGCGRETNVVFNWSSCPACAGRE